MIGTKYLSEAVDINNLETEKLSEYVFMFLSSFIVFNLLINTKNNANL